LLAHCHRRSGQLKGSDLEGDYKQIQERLAKLEEIRKKNKALEEVINRLTNESSKNSNGYIEMVAKRLADEQKRSEVTKLERLVIIGANINTISNYELKVRFALLRENPAEKEEFLNYLAILMKNVDRDVKILAGKPY
jgi:methyl-accepting chemotaxis protein